MQINIIRSTKEDKSLYCDYIIIYRMYVFIVIKKKEERMQKI